MKHLVTCMILWALCQPAFSQESMEKVMERRAREMYRVIGLDSPDEWKKFIRENYTQALIDKPMQAKVNTGGSSGAETSSSSKESGNLEAKADMFRRLHDDFGGGSIKSIKATGEKLDMKINSDGMMGTFTLRFSKEKPYLIDGIGIEVGGNN